MDSENDVVDYETMCMRITQGLADDDIKHIKFMLRDTIKKASSQKIVDGRDLVRILEEREYFSRNDVEKLEKLLTDAKLHSLAMVVHNYGANTSGYVNWGSITSYYTAHYMPIVHNFVETENYRLMADIINKEKAVLVKGPHGSGKSQNAFHYARTFRRRNGNSVVWRINCKSMGEMHISFARLMLALGIREVVRYSEDNIQVGIEKMFQNVYNKLTDNEYVKYDHLIIMDDMASPSDAQNVHDIMEHFIIAQNIFVIGTSQNRFSPLLSQSYGHDIESGLLEEEVIELFKSVTNQSEPNEIEDIQMLAKKLDNLPLCLALAFSYIRITKSSVAKYNTDWSKLQEQAHDISKIGKHFEASYHLTLEKIEADLPENCRNCLAYVPYISHNAIPIQILESFLVSGTSVTEAAVSRLIEVLNDYSLATVSGVGDNRVVSIHSVTAWFLEKRKTENQIQTETLCLLKHFCYHIDNDARLEETMNRNVMFLEHACCLLKRLEKIGEKKIFEMMIFECYLCCSVGITFQLYGNTQLSADHFFKKAEIIMFKMIECPSTHVSNGEEDGSASYSTIKDFLEGNAELKEHARDICRALTRKSKEIKDETIKQFVLKKFRSKRDIRLIRKYGEFTEIEIPGNTIPAQYFTDLIERKVIMRLEDIKDTFLFNLIITILYNYSKNIYFIEETKDDRPSSTKGQNFTAIAHSQIQYAHNLAKELDIYIQGPYFHSVGGLLTKRRGVLYFLQTTKHTESIKGIIQMMEGMYSSCSTNFFFDFGVLKVCRDFNLYNRCMTQNVLRRSYLNLSELLPAQRDKYIKEALIHTDKMESILSGMEPWLALSNVHLDIAVTYMSVEYPDVTKAKHHFKMALKKSELPSRYRFTAYSYFIKFCKQHGNEEDFKFAENMSKEVLRQATKDEQKSFVKKSIEELNQKNPRSLSEEETDSCPANGQQQEIIDGRQTRRKSDSNDSSMESKSNKKDETRSGEHSEQTNQLIEFEELDEERLSIEKERIELDKERLKLERKELQQREDRLAFDKYRLERETEVENERIKLKNEWLKLNRERLELDRKILEQEKERFEEYKRNSRP